jgi:hypothetical protein
VTTEAKVKLDVEYEQINENIRFLADVRFKLLALVPVTGGAAVFILSQRVGLQTGEVASTSFFELLPVLLIALFGFLATLGITLYDQRNSELYNALIHRAKHLEITYGATPTPGSIERLQYGGQYSERPRKHRRMIFKAGHDLALALIYGPLLGAWLFPISYASVRLASTSQRSALTASVIMAMIGGVGFAISLTALDHRDRELYKAAAIRDWT